MAHFKAGKLGDPYKHLNAREHEKLEQKVWYYKKEFKLPAQANGKNILLNFDGIDYFAKVWLNGNLLGTHTGIFGGPVIDISDRVSYDKANDLIVEVISANYQNPGYDNRKPGKIIKGWFLTGGSAMEPFLIWAFGETCALKLHPTITSNVLFCLQKTLKISKRLLASLWQYFPVKTRRITNYIPGTPLRYPITHSHDRHRST